MTDLSLIRQMRDALPDLHRQVMAMEDDAFERAVAAVARSERRRRREEQPGGYMDAKLCWMPVSAECTDTVRQARPPTAAFPNAYQMACRSLAHCVELECADLDDALAVKRWAERLARELGEWEIDPSVHRSAMKLQEALESTPRMATPARRVRL